MSTGENDQALRKILDMTRLMSILIQGLHFYYNCYRAFENWRLTSLLTERIIDNIVRTGLFKNFHTSKLVAAAFLFISLLGATGRKTEKLKYRSAIIYIAAELILYFGSHFVLSIFINVGHLAFKNYKAAYQYRYFQQRKRNIPAGRKIAGK